MRSRLEMIAQIEGRLRKKVEGRDEAIAEYFENLLASSVSAGTIQNYVGAILRFDDYTRKNFGHSCANASSKETVQFFRTLQSKVDQEGKVVQASYSRQASTWCALNNFFKYLQEAEYREKNPMALIKKPSQNKDKPKRYFFTPDELKCLMDAAKRKVDEQTTPRKWASAIRNYTILTLLCHSGMRVSPALNIDLADIDWKNKTVDIMEKRDRYYKYSMRDTVFEAMLWWNSTRHILTYGRNDCSAFFVGLEGKRLTTQVFAQWLETLEIELVGDRHLAPHKLRASFATNLIKEVKDINLVKQAMHHTSINTTQIYLVDSNEAEEQASAVMESLLG